ncbi:EF-hand domain-containing protein, partial [Sphingomonas sp.]|uniref:EF-hand domain-containing protein n=1 Tax=Sphingomonas sp. TaxID=28214 RepID=UPI0017CF8AA8|nr:EF-hand domain-containing protein [Sphingomonas sp.]
MKTFLFGGVAAVALAAVAPAVAQVPAAGAAKVQSRADVAAKVQRKFARLDANRDGAITQAEVQALRGQRVAKRAQRAQRRDPGQRFARLDTNSDGQVTRAEFDALAAARTQRRAAAGKAVASRPQAGERLFARLDT